MIAFIIFKNDEPMKVVLNDDERALRKMRELENTDYNKNSRLYNSIERYHIEAYWHLHEVEVLT